MPKYTIEFDTDVNNREAGLQFVVTRHNASLPEGGKVLDGAGYLQHVFDGVLDDYASQAVKSDAAAVIEKFARADQATRDQVKSVLESAAELIEVKKV